MPAGRVLATQQARDAAKQLLALTGTVKEHVRKVLQQGGLLADPQRWNGGVAGKWRNDWGQDSSQLNQTAAKLDELERRAHQVVEDIFKADGAPPSAGSRATSGLGPGEDTSLADYLRGLWALPTTYRKFIEGRVPELDKAVKQSITDAREEARLANGRFGPWTNEGHEKFGDAKTKLASVEEDLTSAASHENLLTKALGFSVNDIPAVSKALDGAGNWLKVASDIPVIDIAAAGIGTVVNAQDDMDKYGRPWYVAYPGEAVANVAAIGAGTAAIAGAGAVGAAIGAPVVGVAVGVVVGGVVAVGVGDFGHNLIDENWSADIHQHGVAAGIADGIGDSAVKTGKDLGHMATSVWHGITSIF